MHAQSIRGYLRIGYNLRYLLDASTDYYVYGDKRAVDTIHVFIRACEESGLHVTSRAARELYATFLTKYPAAEDSEEAAEATLTRQDVKSVTEASYQIQTVMMSEAEGVFAYVTKDKRFPVNRLLGDISALMSPGIFAAMPEVAKYDFAEAGRCVAFEAPTAAAFHLMRGTEDVLKYFYLSIVRQKRVKLMWGPMVTHLRKRRRPPPDILLNNLDSLRVGFRNPTQHPEKIYDIEEAQDLLSLSIEAVNRMMKHLQESVSPKSDHSAP